MIGMFAAMTASGQFLGVQRPVEPQAHPVSQPLPRRFVGVHPTAIYAGLVSDSKGDRRRALQDLGMEGGDASQPIPAELRAVNLDSDPELEYVLIVESPFPPASVAFVFDQDARGWWQVGRFNYGYHWLSNMGEDFVTLREIVWPDRKEILVREASGGTGAAERDLSIFRMNHGMLYGVFRAIEDLGAGDEVEHRDFVFSDHSYAEPAYIVVKLQKGPEGGKTTESCAAYRWNPASFEFAEDKSAAGRKQCAGD